MPESSGYEHGRYEGVRRNLRFWIRVVAGMTVKIDSFEGAENIPAEGPLLLYSNHISLIDPVMIIHAVQRNIVPLAKIETYAYPVIGMFPRLWHVIPVQRGEVDRRALQGCLDVLRAGEIVWVAPEGTRRPALLEAKDGMAYLAAKTGVPLMPIAVDGTIGFPVLPFSRRRIQGPGVTLKFGRRFRFKPLENPRDRASLHKMTLEAMYILSAILPPERRGNFADLSRGTVETIEWLD
ncbi:MAG: 1-acyl-sn-glycerol-3-phosphate acyltransferase [Anaerolineales bacterium]|nr:1-acyl-sn-glycerol-3-phosphate acyltransferase [Anaerolineales bacterium]